MSLNITKTGRPVVLASAGQSRRRCKGKGEEEIGRGDGEGVERTTKQSAWNHSGRIVITDLYTYKLFN